MKELFYDKGKPLFQTDVEKLKEDEDELRQAQARRWEEDFVKTFCETSHGRRVLWFLIHESFLYRKFKQSNAEAYKKEGKREFALDIIDVIGAEAMLESLINVKQEAARRGKNATHAIKQQLKR